MNITLDRQTLTQRCRECALDFTVVRGSAFDAGHPLGLYLIALHGHTPQGRLAHLAVALKEGSGAAHSLAAALDVTATAQEFELSVVEWTQSPWKDESYLGDMLGRDAVLRSPLKATFFHVADHVIAQIPEVQEYLA